MKRETITTNFTNIKIIKEYYEQFYTYDLTTYTTFNSLKETNYQNLLRYKYLS